MNSAQLDVTRGTRGEIAKLIGSPSRPARRTLWMPGLVPHIHSNYCYTHLCHMDQYQSTTQRAEYIDGLTTECHIFVACLGHTAAVQCHTQCRRHRSADVTKHQALWSFFSQLFRIFHLLTSPPRLQMPQCALQPISHPLLWSKNNNSYLSPNEWPSHFQLLQEQYTDCSLNQIWKCILFSRIIKR